MLTTRVVRRRDGTSVPLKSNISRLEGEFIQDVIRKYRPTVTLEIGFAYGISTLFICEALTDVGGTRHIVIDPAPIEGWLEIGLANVERAGYSALLDLHQESSHLALPALERAGVRVGMALIDGWHTFDYALVDFFYVDRLLDVGGIVVFDDTDAYPAVAKVAEYVARHRAYTLLSTPAGSNCLAFRKLADDHLGDGSGGTRRWDQHVNF